MEAVAPLANDPIMLGSSIRLYRHLERKNLSMLQFKTGIDIVVISNYYINASYEQSTYIFYDIQDIFWQQSNILLDFQNTTFVPIIILRRKI